MVASDRPQLRVPEPAEVTGRLRAVGRRLAALLRSSEHRTLIALVLLAGVLRLVYLDLVPFGLRQVAELDNALPLVESFRLPLVGAPAEWGIRNPPWASYLYSAPLLAGRDARAVAAWSVLLHLIGLVGLYLTVRRAYGRRAATLACLLLAVNPWAIVSARSLTATGLLLPFGVLLLYGLTTAIVERRPWGWTVAALGLALCVGISLSALWLVPGLALLTLAYRRRVHWGFWLLGDCLLVLVLFPYLYHLNVTRLADWHKLGELWRSARGSESALALLRQAADLHASTGLAALAAPSAEQFAPLAALARGLDGLGHALFGLAAIALLPLAACLWARWQHGRDPAGLVVLAAWLWGPLALIALLRPAGLAHDALLFLYPSGFVAMGVALDWLLALPQEHLARRNWWTVPLVQLPIWLLLAALVGWQAFTTLYLDVFVARHDVSAAYGVPYRFVRRIANVAERETTEASVHDTWVLGQSATPIGQVLQPALAFLLGPATGSIATGSPGATALLQPAERAAVYVYAGAPTALLDALPRENRGLVTLPGAEPVSIDTVSAQPAADLLARVQRPGAWAFQSGPMLVGYDWPPAAQAGATARVVTYWTFGSVPPTERASDYELVLLLAGPDGRGPSVIQPFGLATAQWEPGRLLAIASELALPAEPGTHTLAVGLRSAAGYSAHLDATGATQGDLALLGGVDVAP
ncbi:MAG: glycosyltransferase family 39 protein [Chloroflexi bacterium]|nr:glycosyltransferase family 39 protein [Chloroflexota bacterium]